MTIRYSFILRAIRVHRLSPRGLMVSICTPPEFKYPMILVILCTSEAVEPWDSKSSTHWSRSRFPPATAAQVGKRTSAPPHVGRTAWKPGAPS